LSCSLRGSGLETGRTGTRTALAFQLLVDKLQWVPQLTKLNQQVLLLGKLQ